MTAPRRMTYSRAHPRSRGEHTSTARPPRTYAGSSPLARGTRGVVGRCHRRRGLIPARAGNTNDREGHRRCRGGLIPARAGNTWTVRQGTCRLWAHPRSRGEHLLRLRSRSIIGGSSPLARETLTDTSHPLRPSGLIPARAGNTSDSANCERRRRAHPRSRGEHIS